MATVTSVDIHTTAENIEHLDSAERPAAPFRTETFRKSRPTIAGPDEPEAPFPIKLAGPVQHGFGRGGKDLGCPTGQHLGVMFGTRGTYAPR